MGIRKGEIGGREMKLKSIRAKISLLMVTSSVLLIVALLGVSYQVNTKNITDLCESYLYDTCISASDTLYESFYGDPYENVFIKYKEWKLFHSFLLQ